MKREELTELIVDAKGRRQISWESLAQAISRPPAWTVAALLGQHPLSGPEALTLVELLGLDEAVIPTLTRVPMRGSLKDPVPTDPTIYRFYEVIQVYGPAIKELIHEKFGDGIMSAINFSLAVEEKKDPAGDRVVVTMSGKFLPYDWKE